MPERGGPTMNKGRSTGTSSVRGCSRQPLPHAQSRRDHGGKPRAQHVAADVVEARGAIGIVEQRLQPVDERGVQGFIEVSVLDAGCPQHCAQVEARHADAQPAQRGAERVGEAQRAGPVRARVGRPGGAQGRAMRNTTPG